MRGTLVGTAPLERRLPAPLMQISLVLRSEKRFVVDFVQHFTSSFFSVRRSETLMLIYLFKRTPLKLH